jgi:hypothetical protein
MEGATWVYKRTLPGPPLSLVSKKILRVLSNCCLTYYPSGKLASYMLMQAMNVAPSVRWYTQLKDQMVGMSPDHQLKLREKRNLQHTYSVALEKTRIADLVNELRLDPERFVDLVRFTNLQNYHSSAWMDLPPTNKYNTFTNMELQSALAFYTGERIPLLPSSCNCKSKDLTDTFGNDTIICKTEAGGPTRRHDGIKFVMQGMLMLVSAAR